jgi:hypothetical protein
MAGLWLRVTEAGFVSGCCRERQDGCFGQVRLRISPDVCHVRSATTKRWFGWVNVEPHSCERDSFRKSSSDARLKCMLGQSSFTALTPVKLPIYRHRLTE